MLGAERRSRAAEIRPQPDGVREVLNIMAADQKLADEGTAPVSGCDDYTAITREN
jgi:hypothetical protein